MKGRKPSPTALKMIMGNPGKKRLKVGEPKPESDIPTPPEHLDEYAREEWYRLATGLYNLGILYDIDRAIFANYCIKYSEVRACHEILNHMAAEDREAAFLDKKPSGIVCEQALRKIADQAALDMLKFGAEFGLTPSSRVRLAIDPGRKPSKFDGLIGAKSKERFFD